MKLLRECGIEVALITARSSAIVAQRATELGIEHVYQGCHEKLASLRALCQILSLDAAQVGYMGDDLPDLAALGWVGLAVAPANASMDRAARALDHRSAGAPAPHANCAT